MVSLRDDVPRPTVEADDDVVVRVAMAGLCRTDLYVADGRIAGRDPLVLGHEFAGTVADAGDACREFQPGDRVTAMPVVPCRACAACRDGRARACLDRAFLGIERDGAFAEYVRVPRRVLHALPASLSLREGAYAEPVAAALAVLEAPIRAGERGVVYGDGRVAQLALRVLRARGFADVALHDPRGGAPLARDAYDFVVETVATTEALAEMLAAVRPRGRIVLKSRLPHPVAIDLPRAVLKEVSFHAVNYGSFDDALALLAGGALAVDDLLGGAYALDDHARAFEDARRGESAKLFFAIDPAAAA